MDKYKGVIIEEALSDRSILKQLNIISTKVEAVTEKHQTPWLRQWTLHAIEVEAKETERIAQLISQALEGEHHWYADFKNDTNHFVVFRNKVFRINREDKQQYDQVIQYGISLGIPDYQLDFSAEIQ